MTADSRVPSAHQCRREQAGAAEIQVPGTGAACNAGDSGSQLPLCKCPSGRCRLLHHPTNHGGPPCSFGEGQVGLEVVGAEEVAKNRQPLCLSINLTPVLPKCNSMIR